MLPAGNPLEMTLVLTPPWRVACQRDNRGRACSDQIDDAMAHARAVRHHGEPLRSRRTQVTPAVQSSEPLALRMSSDYPCALEVCDDRGIGAE